MVVTLSAIAPDDHVEVFLEILFEFGFELVDIDNLLSNPGFENILYSTSFEQLLRRFPPNDLSSHSLELLIHAVTDETLLEDLASEEFVPTFVDLLAKRLVKAVGLEMDNISARSCPLSVTGNHISALTQPAPHANKIPSYSAEIRSALIPTGSGIYPNSAFSSQQTSRCNIHHTVPFSGMLAPNETLPIYSSIAHGNNPAIRPLSTAVKINYKPNIGAAQHSPKLGFQPNALDGRNYVSGGKCQCGNHERGTHHGSTPYLRHAPHCSIGSTLTASVFIPDHSATLSSLTSYRSPHLIQGSMSLSIEDASDLKPVAELLDTEPSRSVFPLINDSAIYPNSAINSHMPRYTISHDLPSPRSLPPNEDVDLQSYVDPVSVFGHSLWPKSTCQPSGRSPHWSIINRSVQSRHTESTHVGGNSSHASETPTLVNPSSPDWWDRGWSSDSLFSSDDEEDYAVSGKRQYSDSGFGTSHEDTAYLEHEPGEPEEPDINGPQSGHLRDLLYDSDGDHQRPDNLAILLDSSFDPGNTEQEDDPHADLEGADELFNRDSFDEPGYDSGGGSNYGLGHGSNNEDDFTLEVGNVEYDDDVASQRSDEWGIPPDEQSNHGYESPCEDDECFEDEVESGFGDPYEDDQLFSDDDGASQRSDEWGNFLEYDAGEVVEGGDGYQSEDDMDQYESGGNEGPYHRLALVSQTFPQSLWSLQLPKPTRTCLPKLNVPSKPTGTLLVSFPLLETLASHIPFLITLHTFESFFRTTSAILFRDLQLSRQFISYLEESDVIVDYREHLLLPGDDESDSEDWDEEIVVTHHAMDDIFGVGSAFSESPHHAEHSDLSNSRDPAYHTDEDIVLGNEASKREDQPELQGENGLNGYLALVPQDFPLSLRPMQLPKVAAQTHYHTQLEPVMTTFLITPESPNLRVLSSAPTHATGTNNQYKDIIETSGHLPHCLKTSTPDTSNCLAVEHVSYGIFYLSPEPFSTSFSTHHGPVPTSCSPANRAFLWSFHPSPPITILERSVGFDKLFEHGTDGLGAGMQALCSERDGGPRSVVTTHREQKGTRGRHSGGVQLLAPPSAHLGVHSFSSPAHRSSIDPTPRNDEAENPYGLDVLYHPIVGTGWSPRLLRLSTTGLAQDTQKPPLVPFLDMSPIPDRSSVVTTARTSHITQRNTRIHVKTGTLGLKRQEKQLGDVPRHNGAILQGKNERLNGGVKTHAPQRNGPHFSLATLPNNQIHVSRIEDLVDHDKKITDLRSYYHDLGSRHLEPKQCRSAKVKLINGFPGRTQVLCSKRDGGQGQEGTRVAFGSSAVALAPTGAHSPTQVTPFEFQIPLLDALSPHIPYLVVSKAFEPFLQAVRTAFIRNLHFPCYLVLRREGTNVLFNYRDREHLPMTSQGDQRGNQNTQNSRTRHL
ncbi:hypothetical protein PQX77_020971 [Marasmius sp. AFHP31]|nr:hypothetical protein PQX77_020971 [Marasmius sp. AFHP31]